MASLVSMLVTGSLGHDQTVRPHCINTNIIVQGYRLGSTLRSMVSRKFIQNFGSRPYETKAKRTKARTHLKSSA